MRPFRKMVNDLVDAGVTSRIDQVVLLAINAVDARIKALQAAVDAAVKAKKFVYHRTHEHKLAATCTCELCRVYREIAQCVATRRSLDYSCRYHDGSAETKRMVQCFDQRIHKLHNMRRALMGLPLK